MITNEITVELGERTYPIYVGSGMLSSFSATLERHGLPKSLVLITDRRVGRYHAGPIARSLAEWGAKVVTIKIPPGEQEKSLVNAGRIFTTMLSKGVARKSAVLALGGGVIGDLAGFIAATYHRGIPLVQIPTTLLSQVDSSVGGKTAVNHPLGKNMIGAFYQPTFVWTDIDVLKTLPSREILCGLGEIIKYGVILDESLFSYIEENLEKILALERDAILFVQERCCTLKANLVSQDERETGQRVILNYGHTVGHAIEAAGKYRIYKHGEAVLLGMIAEAFLAKELGYLSTPDHDRIVGLVRRVPLRMRKQSMKIPALMNAMSRDKKSVSGRKRFILPVRIGETTVSETVPQPLILESLDAMISTRFQMKKR